MDLLKIEMRSAKDVGRVAISAGSQTYSPDLLWDNLWSISPRVIFREKCNFFVLFPYVSTLAALEPV